MRCVVFVITTVSLDPLLSSILPFLHLLVSASFIARQQPVAYHRPVGLGCRLIDLAGFPVAAPSANRSGKPSPTCAKHVEDDLSGRISAIIDGEVSSVGVESTIIDGTCFPLLVLRPGGITLSQLREVAGDGAVIPYQDPREGDAAPIAPGMKYVHYAPEAPVYFLCEDLGAEDCRAFISKLRDSNPCPSSVALLTSLDPAEVSGCGADSIVRCGEYGDAGSIARALYGCLRRFDKAEGETGAIVCFGFPSEGVGEAVLNRLKKASQKP